MTLPIHEVHYCTDSSSVIHYIRNETRRFHIFVANRVSRIHSSSSPSQLRYVASKENPADDGSRGPSAAKFVDNDRWLKDPEFLMRDRIKWPATPDSFVVDDD